MEGALLLFKGRMALRPGEIVITKWQACAPGAALSVSVRHDEIPRDALFIHPEWHEGDKRYIVGGEEVPVRPMRLHKEQAFGGKCAGARLRMENRGIDPAEAMVAVYAIPDPDPS